MKYYAYARVKFPVTDTHVYISPIMLLFFRKTGIHHLWLSNLTTGGTPELLRDVNRGLKLLWCIRHVRLSVERSMAWDSTDRLNAGHEHVAIAYWWWIDYRLTLDHRLCTTRRRRRLLLLLPMSILLMCYYVIHRRWMNAGCQSVKSWRDLSKTCGIDS